MSEKSFTDLAGREWHLNFTVGDAMELKRELGIDVGKLLEKENGELEKIIQDEWVIAQILAIQLGPQLQRRDMLMDSGDGDGSKTPTRSFFDGLGGEVLDSAILAFLHAVAESLPKLKRRAMKAMLQKLSPTIEAATLAMEKKILEKKTEEEVAAKVEAIKF